MICQTQHDTCISLLAEMYRFVLEISTGHPEFVSPAIATFMQDLWLKINMACKRKGQKIIMDIMNSERSFVTIID